MQKLGFILSFFCISIFRLSAQGVFEFKEVEYDFGTIKEGTQATHTFTFKNVGKAPILISNVKPSCGCTAPEWSKDPVLPEQTSSIKVVYNSKGRPGSFYKTVTILSNASKNDIALKIKGNVLPKDAKDDSSVRQGY